METNLQETNMISFLLSIIKQRKDNKHILRVSVPMIRERAVRWLLQTILTLHNSQSQRKCHCDDQSRDHKSNQ